MTDRIYALTVVLDKDYRDDDVEAITNAIKMIRGVLKVTNHIATSETYMAQERARRELTEKLWGVLRPNSG